MSHDAELAEMMQCFCRFIHLASKLGAPSYGEENDQEEQFFDRHGACKFLAVSPSTLRRFREQGKLEPAYHVGRSPRFAQTQLESIRDELKQEKGED